MKTHGYTWLGLSVLLLAGLCMVAPTAFAASDGGYSATCKDGTAWTGAAKRGACRGHKGVKGWNSEGGASAAGAMCKDGTSWSGKSRRGACRGHKGVASWSGSEAAAAPAAAPPANEAAASRTARSRRASMRTASVGGSMGAPAPGGGAGKVWVNTETKTYHCQGTKWYGTTKHGEYMTEAQATAQGDHADHGKACSG